LKAFPAKQLQKKRRDSRLHITKWPENLIRRALEERAWM
jgi:hypothetical protein